MKYQTVNIEIEAEEALRKALASVPFIQIYWEAPLDKMTGMAGDFQADVATQSGNRKRLLVEIKTKGEPRFAREAVMALRFRSNEHLAAYPVFVAPYISPKSASICDEANVGYVDFAGNCKLSFDQIYIERSGMDNPFSDRRSLRSMFSPRSERIVRTLLEAPGRSWKDIALKDQARVSIGLVSKVKQLLLEKEWVDLGSAGWIVTDPMILLSAWTDNYRPDRHDVYQFYSQKTPAEIEQTLIDALESERIAYALTAYSASSRWAPMVMYRKVSCYLSDIPGRLTDDPSIKRVDSGGNIELIVPYDDGFILSGRFRRDAQVATAAQTFLDLQHQPGRAAEAAETMLNLIRNRWVHAAP